MYRSSATTILVDVSASMAAPCNGIDGFRCVQSYRLSIMWAEKYASMNDSKRDVGALAARSIIQTRMIASKTHEFGVVVFGCNETDNQLADDESYQNCVELIPINKPNAETILQTATIPEPSGIQGGRSTHRQIACCALFRDSFL